MRSGDKERGSLLMAKADAWGIPTGGLWRRWRWGRRVKVAGNARILAAPAYERLLAMEPYLRKAIPALIVLFLLVIAAARFLSMMTWRDDIERDAKVMLGLAANNLSQALQLATGENAPTPDEARALLNERSEERRVGKEARSRGWRCTLKLR